MCRKRVVIALAIALCAAGVFVLSTVNIFSGEELFTFNRGISNPPSQDIAIPVNSIVFNGNVRFADKRIPKQVEWVGEGNYRQRLDIYKGYVDVEVPEENFTSREGILSLVNGIELSFLVPNVPNIKRVKKISVKISAPDCKIIVYKDLPVKAGAPYYSVKIPDILLTSELVPYRVKP